MVVDTSDADVENRIKAAPNIVVIQPERNMTVPVDFEIVAFEPEPEFEPWDHIAEASLRLPSGQLEIHECTGGPIDRFSLQSGTYRVRCYYGGLNEVSEKWREANDHYKLVLWPAPYAPVSVLKQFRRHRAG